MKYTRGRSIRERLLDSVVAAHGGCWHSTYNKDKDGYPNFSINSRRKRAARVSYEEFGGEIPNGLHVCHSCDNRSCINPAHLFLGTNLENHRDKVSKGRQVRGTRVHTALLTEGDVRQIRSRHDQTGAALARAFGVRKETIYAIRNGSSWSHII
jgi:hypothetical protein